MVAERLLAPETREEGLSPSLGRSHATILMRAPATADGLEPFAEPGLCVARLMAHDGPGSP